MPHSCKCIKKIFMENYITQNRIIYFKAIYIKYTYIISYIYLLSKAMTLDCSAITLFTIYTNNFYWEHSEHLVNTEGQARLQMFIPMVFPLTCP